MLGCLALGLVIIAAPAACPRSSCYDDPVCVSRYECEDGDDSACRFFENYCASFPEEGLCEVNA